MFKKLAVLTVILALFLPLGGCCQRLGTDGKVTKSFPNCLIKAQEFICAPPEAAKEVVTAAIPLLVATLNTMIPGTSGFINVNSAAATAENIRQGLCVFVTDLNNLIGVLQTVSAQETQAKMLRTKALAKPIDVQVLINWKVTATAK